MTSRRSFRCRPATLHILVALSDRDRHGYAIIQDVAVNTGQAVQLSAGTPYRSIQRMLEQVLIVERRERPLKVRDDERRRYYRLTPFGAASSVRSSASPSPTLRPVRWKRCWPASRHRIR